MKAKLFALIIILCFSRTNAISQTTMYNVKNFGAVGDGKHDDYLAIQTAFDKAKNTKNSTVLLEPGKIYFISRPVQINSNFNGNTSTIIPKSSQALSIYSSNINIENLKITGSNFQYIRIDKDGIKFRNCNFVTSSYFVLLSVNGDNISIENSILENKYINERSFSLHSTSGISNFSLIKCKIVGAILFKNDSLKKSSNFNITNNELTVDYTSLPSSVKTQNDAITFSSISDVQINNNKITLLNVNRGVKITDKGKYAGKSLMVSNMLPTNYSFEGNSINADSKSGKQLFDFYIGTKNISIERNNIIAKGFTTLFENKTKLDLGARKFLLNDNTISFDSEILYFDGYGKNNDRQNQVIITNNRLKYSSKQFKFKSKRGGQENDVKFNYIFNVRNVDDFVYQNNQFSEEESNLNFANRYFFFIQNPLSVDISSSNYKGGIKYIPVRANSKINYKGNINNETKFKQAIVTDSNNKVNFNIVK